MFLNDTSKMTLVRLITIRTTSGVGTESKELVF